MCQLSERLNRQTRQCGRKKFYVSANWRREKRSCTIRNIATGGVCRNPPLVAVASAAAAAAAAAAAEAAQRQLEQTPGKDQPCAKARELK